MALWSSHCRADASAPLGRFRRNCVLPNIAVARGGARQEAHSFVAYAQSFRPLVSRRTTREQAELQHNCRGFVLFLHTTLLRQDVCAPRVTTLLRQDACAPRVCCESASATLKAASESASNCCLRDQCYPLGQQSRCRPTVAQSRSASCIVHRKSFLQVKPTDIPEIGKLI